MVAKVGDVGYETLEAAFAAATEGQTITLLQDAAPALTSQRAITKAAVIDLGGKTLTLMEDDLYFGTITFLNGTIVVDPSVKPSTAVFWMFANQTLTFDAVKIVATGVTGTYLIGLDGDNADLNLLNGSEILVENTTALDLDIVCVNASTGNDIVIDSSKVNVTNLDGRVLFRGNYTIKGNSKINLDGITKAGIRIEAGQTLSIEDTASVTIAGEPRDGGIHLTDVTATYTKADTATVTATVNRPAIAQIGDAKYASLAEAVAAAQNGDEIVLLADVTLDAELTLPAGIKFNGNGKTVAGTIKAGGNLEFVGNTIVSTFNPGWYNNVITIGAGASLKATSGRMTVSYGNTFNITGSIADGAAKTADKTTITPSLELVGGVSFNGDGGGVNLNVLNAYVKLGDSTTKHSGATGKFNLNFTNSIVDFTKTLKTYMPTADGLAPEFSLNAKDSVIDLASHLEFWLDDTAVMLDNTELTVGGSFANAGTLALNNNSEFIVKAPIMSSHGGNTGTITVNSGTFELVDNNEDWENAGEMTVGAEGTLKINDFKCVDEGVVSVDVTGMNVGTSIADRIVLNSANTDFVYSNIKTTGSDLLVVDDDGKLVERPLVGSGTEADPFVIASLADLELFRAKVNGGNSFAGKFVKMTADIDLNNVEWTPIAYMGKTFKGTFDGNGKTISNLKITKELANAPANNGIGFFGRTDDPAVIKNLTIENVDITGSLHVGAIVGNGYTGKAVENCTVKGDITIDAWWYAGVIGGNGYMNTIKDCHVIGAEGSYIKGNSGSYIGGIWGFRGEGANSIVNCSVQNLKVIGVDRVGGIAGIGHYGNKVSTCSVKNVTITANDPDATTVGLIVGACQGTASEPSVFENNVVAETVARVDNGDGTFKNVAGIYGTNINGSVPVTNFEASINGVPYADIQEAIKAAAPAGTVTLLKDVVVDEWKMVTEDYNIASGELITLTMNGLTIDGNGKTLTVNAIKSAGNGGYLFQGATSLTVKNLTINVAEGLVGGIALKSGTIENVTFNGGKYAVLPGSGDVIVKDCAFNGITGYAVYFEEDRDNLVVTGNTFNCADGAYAVTLRGAADFTTNTVVKGRVNLANSAKGEVSGNDFGTDRFKVYNGATATITGNTINNLVFNDASAVGSCFANNTFSDEAEAVYLGAFAVAQIGDVKYLTLADALAAVGAGDVEITLLKNATLDYYAREAYGAADTTSITVNGNGKTLTLNQKDSDCSSLGLANAAGKLVLNNMTIEKTGYGDTSGTWNTHSIIFTSNVEMTHVTVNNAIAVQNGAKLDDVTINEANGYYGLWINGNGQSVTVNGGAFNATNGGRGIKIADQYVDAPASVTLTVNGTKFNTAAKAAILVSSTAGANIAVSNVDITNVSADSANVAWVDEDWAANYGKVTVTGGTLAQENIASFVASVTTASGVPAYYKDLHEAMVACKTGGTVALLKDVDLGNVEWEPVSFAGAFDGQNKTISNLTINKPRVSNTGFITLLNGSFANVTIKNATVTGGECTGIIAARSGGTGALAENITITGTIKVETTHSGYARAGGVVGGWAYGNYRNITIDGVDASVSYIKHTGGGDGRYVAGIVGHADGVESYVNCVVKNITISGGWLCGGIAGPGPSDGRATGCAVENIKINANYSGGMFGWYYGDGTIQDSSIKNVEFTADTTKNGAIGGYSSNPDATVENVTIENVTNNGQPLIEHVAAIDTTYYMSLQAAVDAAQDGDTVEIVKAGTYKVPTGKNITITGAVDGVVFENIGAHNMGGASMTFKNVTFDYYPNVNYIGLQHSGDLVYNNCTFNGQVFLYGASETFNNCTFNQNSADAYNVWTYTADVVNFNECTFNSAGKSVLVYNENSAEFNTVNVAKCKFIASAPVDGKAAIEMDSSRTAGINLTIDAATTATGFGSGNVSGNSLWNNKMGNSTDANNDITVVVDGKTALAPIVAKVGETGYTTLAAAFAALSAQNHTLMLLKDAAWDAATPVYWAAGTKSGYAATLTAALTAAYKADAGAITIVCRPGADVGEMTHGHVADDLTIYGNNAYLSGGECDLEVDQYKFSRTTGKEAVDGAYLEKDITITAYELDNLGVWGERHTANKVTVNLTDCDGKALEGKENVQRVYISGTTGVNNITLTGCDFLTKATAVYSNADGAITAVNCSFKGGQVPFNINHKANGTQTVAVENCTFTNCGDVGDWKQFAAPLRLVNSGTGTQSAEVTGCAFAGTVGANGDILLGDGRTGQASNDVELKVVDTAANIQAQKPGYYNGETVDETKKATVTSPASGTLETSVAKLLPVDPRTLGYATSGKAEALPATPDMDGEVVNVTAAQAQYVLDGAYGPIDGKTINFTESINDTLILGRASKYDGSGTVYRHGSHDGEALSYADFIAYKNQSVWTESCYYERTVENVTFTANEGVTVKNFEADGGAHIYADTAPVYDYVRDTGSWVTEGSCYYKRAILKNITFKGLTFKAKTDINTSESTTVYDGFTFKNCTFDLGTTADGNQAIRYYNENDNGNVKNLVVEGCTFKTCFQGVYTAHVKNVTVKGCTFDTTGHNAIAIQDFKGACDHGAVVITGNTFKNIGDRAIRFNVVAAGTTITITGNTATYRDGTAATDKECIKAQTLAEGVTTTVELNNWNNYAVAANKPLTETVAKIGTTDYKSLEDATEAAQDGDVITIVGYTSNMTAPDGWKFVTEEGVTTLVADPVLLKGADGKFHIASCDDLLLFRKMVNEKGMYFLGETVVLDKDIDMVSVENWTPIGNAPEKKFAGTFDGRNHTISGLKITGGSYVGLFGYLGAATVQNVALVGANVSGVKRVGALVGQIAGNATIKNCSLDATSSVAGSDSNTGGLIGEASGSIVVTLENLTNNAPVTNTESGTSRAAGILCQATSGASVTLKNCVNKGTITTNGGYAGGIVSAKQGGASLVFDGCSNTGTLANGTKGTGALLAWSCNGSSVTISNYSGDVANAIGWLSQDNYDHVFVINGVEHYIRVAKGGSGYTFASRYEAAQLMNKSYLQEIIGFFNYAKTVNHNFEGYPATPVEVLKNAYSTSDESIKGSLFNTDVSSGWPQLLSAYNVKSGKSLTADDFAVTWGTRDVLFMVSDPVTVVVTDTASAQAALDAATPNTTIIFKSGTYEPLFIRQTLEKSTRRSDLDKDGSYPAYLRSFKNLTLIAEVGAEVVSKGITAEAGLFWHASAPASNQAEMRPMGGFISYLALENVTIDGIAFDSTEQSAVTLRDNGAVPTRGNIMVDGLTIQNCTGRGVASNENIHFLAAGGGTNDQNFPGTEKKSFNNIVVKNCELDSYYQPIAFNNATAVLNGLTVTGNTFSNNGNSNVLQLSNKVNSGAFVIKNNLFKDLNGRVVRATNSTANWTITGNRLDKPIMYDDSGDLDLVKISVKAETVGAAVTESENDWNTGTLANGTYIANGDPALLPVARIGENKYYHSLQAAFDAAQAGDTVTLLSDITLTEQVNITKALDGLTLDGNGKTITCATTDDPFKSGGSALYFGNANDHLYCTGIKIKDLTMTGTARFAIFLCGGTTTEFTNVKISGNYYIAVNLYGTHGATMTNCDISNSTKGTDKYISAIWSNVASANPLTLNNSKVDVIAINTYTTANELEPKIFVMDGSEVGEIHTFDDGSVSGNKKLCVSASSTGKYVVKEYDASMQTWVDIRVTVAVTLGGEKKEMPFPDAWLAANIGADASGWTTEALEAEAANGLAKWQCYLFGLDPSKEDAKVVATAGQGTDKAIPLVVANADASASPLVTGGYVTVAYVLMGSNDRTAWTQVATSDTRDGLAIPLTGTTYKFYRVDVTVTSAEGN